MPAVGLWGGWHLLCFGIALPVAAYVSRRKLATQPLPPRVPFFSSVIVQQLLFLVISLGVAWGEGIPLFPAALPGAVPLGATLLLLVVSCVGMRPSWIKAVRERETRVHLTSPRTPLERRLWVGVSLAAGIGEELTYRGVLYVLLFRLTGSVAAAALLSALFFGAAHVVQGFKAIWITAVFGLVAQGLTLWSGSLYAAMVLHVGYDVVAGLAYGHLAEQLKYDSAVDGPSEART
ncbi:MAG: CPBP family intramembrane metalloprotease [Gemmatimonadetes bacterium]|nr:CPBP family intramembrane metalloprotease [Gemmatimonadota bacterium]